MEPISIIVVDDEPLAREGLCLRLEDVDDFQVVAQCADGHQALQSIIDLTPDVVFLDIEMPGLTGMELMAQLHELPIAIPTIVFVTAYKDFALQAFEYQAFDYLLKPFTEERLDACLEHLRENHLEREALQKTSKLDKLLCRKTGKSLNGLIDSLEHSPGGGVQELQQTISLKSGNDWVRVKLDGILWIEAAGDYMCVYTEDETHVIRKTLKQFEQELDSRHFPRINRSAIVNLRKVSRLTPNSNGEYIAQLHTGHEVKVSRKYKFKLDELRAD